MSAAAITGNTFRPLRQNIVLVRDEDVTITLSMAPQTSVSGWTTALTVYAQIGDTTAEITVAGSISDATTGVITFAIADTDTASLTPGVKTWTIRRTDAGSETVLAHGSLNLLP